MYIILGGFLPSNKHDVDSRTDSHEGTSEKVHKATELDGSLSSTFIHNNVGSQTGCKTSEGEDGGDQGESGV